MAFRALLLAVTLSACVVCGLGKSACDGLSTDDKVTDRPANSENGLGAFASMETLTDAEFDTIISPIESQLSEADRKRFDWELSDLRQRSKCEQEGAAEDGEEEQLEFAKEYNKKIARLIYNAQKKVGADTRASPKGWSKATATSAETSASSPFLAARASGGSWTTGFGRGAILGLVGVSAAFIANALTKKHWDTSSRRQALLVV